jgi:hypothetical protein
VSTTIRVSEETRDRFAKLAHATGRTMTQLVDDAADALERRVFFEQLTAGYDLLRSDPNEWEALVAERAVEDGVVRDVSL